MAIAFPGRRILIAIVGAGLLTAIPSAADATGSVARASVEPRDGRIVYDDPSTGQLYTVNPDGSAVVQLTHMPAGSVAVQPAWFSDASRVVLASNRRTGQFRIFTIRRNGSDLHRVISDGHGYNDFTPAVAPNGRTIVYTRCRPDPPGGCALYAVRTDGTRRRPLTHFRATEADQADFWPDISPDGRHVTFSRFSSGGITARVWVIRIDGTHAHPVTPARLEAAASRWTPDGRHLLVTSSWVHLGEQIYRIAADGSHAVQLTHSRFPRNNFTAAPSPSGKSIAFTSDRAYAQPFSGSDLFVMRASGRHEHVIVSGGPISSDWGSAPLLAQSTAGH
jgi:Tol biopolymer transport system component